MSSNYGKEPSTNASYNNQDTSRNASNGIPVDEMDIDSSRVVVREVAPQVENTAAVKEIEGYSERNQ